MVGGLVIAGALLVAACGSLGTRSSRGAAHPKQSATSSTSSPRSTTTTPAASSATSARSATPATSASSTTSTTSATGGSGSASGSGSGSGSGPMLTASLPVVVCETTTGAPTTTTSLPGSVPVNIPASDAQLGNLAVYTDETGRLMLVGPTVGWTCNGSFGADGSGMLALAPVGTGVPATGNSWHLPMASTTQAIVALESGGSTVQGAALACPLFGAAQSATQQGLGQGCSVSSPSQERVVRTSSVEVGFEDPQGVAGVGYPSGGQNPANGIMLYQPKPTEATAYQATCTLSVAQHDLCTAVLNQFAATFG
jgi:hypothetical protein